MKIAAHLCTSKNVNSKLSKAIKSLTFASALITCSLPTYASPLPASGSEDVYSIALFKLSSPLGATFTTPLLFDAATQIQQIQDSSNPNHVFTFLQSANLKDSVGDYNITAGLFSNPNTPTSTGNITSINNDQSFPAKSSFDIYANITVQHVPNIRLAADSFLYNPNGSPLTFSNTSINQFPNGNIYTYNSPTATPVYSHSLGATTDTFSQFYLTAGLIEVFTIPASSAVNIKTLADFTAIYSTEITNFQNQFDSLTAKNIGGLNTPLTIDSSYTTVPIPTTFWLFASILTGWHFSRFRKFSV